MSGASETIKHRLVFLPREDFDIFYNAVQPEKRMTHGVLAQSKVENFSVVGSGVIYIVEVHKDSMMLKAKTGEQL